jgi:hypothetical protein
MFNSPQYLQHGAAQRCAICDGKFGLVRYYTWRTALCSKKCADRLKARQEGDRNWVRRLQAARQTVAARNHEENSRRLGFRGNEAAQ